MDQESAAVAVTFLAWVIFAAALITWSRNCRRALRMRGMTVEPPRRPAPAAPRSPPGDWLFGVGVLAGLVGLYIVLPLALLAGLVLFVRWVWSW